MRWARKYWLDAISISVALVVFVIPFLFIVLTSAKTKVESAALDMSLPETWNLQQNAVDVFSARNNMLVTAFKNSFILTVVSVTLIVLLCAMVGFVLDRRRDRMSKVVNALVLAGLIIPPAVVPTIFVLQELRLFKTLPGLILVEVAYGIPFAVLLFRAFVSTIPRELDEAAIIDGCTPFGLFFRVVLPLLRPVVVTVIVTSSVFIYNDFTNPLYFLPGSENATVQLTLYNFQSQFSTSWNLLFMDALLITVPPLIMFIFFNRKIVAGMTAGGVKG